MAAALFAVAGLCAVIVAVVFSITQSHRYWPPLVGLTGSAATLAAELVRGKYVTSAVWAFTTVIWALTLWFRHQRIRSS